MDRVYFAHLSDAHIGHRLFDNAFSAMAPLSGYNPHDDRLLEPVYSALEYASEVLELRPDERLPVVFSGDLTSGGTDNDYALARCLFFQRWTWCKARMKGERRLVPEKRVGYGFREGDVFMVPGNHDHWRSRHHQRAYNGLVNRQFLADDDTPWSIKLPSRGGAFELELFFVDSNSGLLGHAWNISARGKISDDELKTLRLQLELNRKTDRKRQRKTVRGFVCHHGFSVDEPHSIWMAAEKHVPFIRHFRFQSLEEESRLLLLYLASHYQIPVVLTGHTHRFLKRPWFPGPALQIQSALDRLGWSAALPASKPWPLYELRSAACLAGPACEHQGFYVHELRFAPDRSREVAWLLRTFQRTGSGEFGLDDRHGVEIFRMSL